MAIFVSSFWLFILILVVNSNGRKREREREREKVKWYRNEGRLKGVEGKKWNIVIIKRLFAVTLHTENGGEKEEII